MEAGGALVQGRTVAGGKKKQRQAKNWRKTLTTAHREIVSNVDYHRKRKQDRNKE